ncbi:MAG TPA: hypothetical protein VGK73_15280, partial [Polyangiaceae bacterium]
MFRDRTWWIALGFGVVSVLGAARDAKACSPPPNGWFAYGPSAVPANGVVIFQYGCEEGCDPEPEPGDFTLESSDGVDVPGQVSASGANRNSHYIVFRPEEGALVEGESYTPLLPGVAYTGAFTAGPDMSLGSMVPVTHEIYSLDHVAGERVCCSGPLDSCGGMPCFHTQYDRSAVLRISWGDAAYGEGTQYAFRVDRYMSAVPEWGYADSMTYFELGDDQTGTCYTLELMRLVDGTVLNLGERCADRPADLVPGIYPTSQDAIEDSL